MMNDDQGEDQHYNSIEIPSDLTEKVIELDNNFFSYDGEYY